MAARSYILAAWPTLSCVVATVSSPMSIGIENDHTDLSWRHDVGHKKIIVRTGLSHAAYMYTESVELWNYCHRRRRHPRRKCSTATWICISTECSFPSRCRLSRRIAASQHTKIHQQQQQHHQELRGNI